MDPQLRFRKEVVVDKMILMAMAVNEDSNGIFKVYCLENIFLAGGVDEGPLSIINKEGMAMGVFAPANEFERPSFKIKHLDFLGIPFLMHHQVSGPGP